VKLSISNLAWKPPQAATALRLLSELGVEGVEIAPTRIASWEALDGKSLKEARRQVEDHGLRVSSLQAIFFGRNDALLLGGEAEFQAFVSHLARVADIAEALGAGIMVFGAPRNRTRGALSEEAARLLGCERLGRIDQSLRDRDAVFAIEPVPEYYGGDFLTSARSVIDMVDLVGGDRVGVHLDTACVGLGGDDISDAIRSAGKRIRHFHASEPDLAGFSDPRMPHRAAAEALRQEGYGKWVAIEMRENAEESLAGVEQAVRWVRNAYELGRDKR